MDALLLKPQPNRDAWLEERQTYLGASDVAGIVGLDNYSTPYKVYLAKKGLLPAEEMSEPAIHGLNLESYVAKLYSRSTGRRPRKSRLYRHPLFEYFGATPDYEINKTRLLECKTCGFYMGQEFGEAMTDEVPRKYLVQCQWQMFVTGRATVDLAVLIAGQDFRVYTIDRDDELIAALRDRALEFWQTYIDSDCPPPLTDAKLDTELFTELHPKEDDSVIYSTAEIDTLATQAESYYAAMKRYEKALDARKNLLRQYMGDAAVLETAVGRFTWKANAAGSRVFKTPFNGK